MTAKRTKPKKSDKIDYAEITEAEVQDVWPDLCMADRYQIAYEKVLQSMPAWKQSEMADKGMPPRHMKAFIDEVVHAAEAENFHVN